VGPCFLLPTSNAGLRNRATPSETTALPDGAPPSPHMQGPGEGYLDVDLRDCRASGGQVAWPGGSPYYIGVCMCV